MDTAKNCRIAKSSAFHKGSENLLFIELLSSLQEAADDCNGKISTFFDLYRKHITFFLQMQIFVKIEGRSLRFGSERATGLGIGTGGLRQHRNQ